MENNMSQFLDSELKLVENEARIFAQITSEAHNLVPLLMSEFDIYFKGSDTSFNLLKISCVGNSGGLVGKKFKATVNWGACGGLDEQNNNMFLEVQGVGGNKYTVLLNRLDMHHCVKKIGLAHKMFAAWEYARGV